MPDEATKEAEEVIEDATEEASEEAELITEEASDELLRIALDATEPEADPDEVGPAAPASEPTPVICISTCIAQNVIDLPQAIV